MTALAFDTHSFVKKLTAAGFTQEPLDLKLAELRAELIKWMTGLLIAQGAVVVALVKLL